jgi:hypothetical protein
MIICLTTETVSLVSTGNDVLLATSSAMQRALHDLSRLSLMMRDRYLNLVRSPINDSIVVE